MTLPRVEYEGSNFSTLPSVVIGLFHSSCPSGWEVAPHCGFHLAPSGFNSPEPPREVSWDQKLSDSRCSPDVGCRGLGSLYTELASEAEAEASRAEPKVWQEVILLSIWEVQERKGSHWAVEAPEGSCI